LQTTRRLQSWFPQHTYDTKHYIQDKTRQQTISHSFTHNS
jgi:hypothetical protein